jgi:8-oxo-dGTP diphosphatase
MASAVPEFGERVPGVEYVLRPGGYAIIFGDRGQLAGVSTLSGLALPGGGQDEGESPEDAAIRETEEECGLRIKVGPQIDVADELKFCPRSGSYYRKRCTFFFAEVIRTAERTQLDHELIWVSPDDALTRLIFQSQRWAVGEALRRKKAK